MKCLRSYRRSIEQSVQVTSKIPVLIRLRGAMFWHVIAVGLMIATLAATGAIAQPVLVTKLLPQAVYGQPYHADLMIGGDSPPDVATIAGLPPGLSAMHNGRGSVVIAGIPAAQGTHALALHASNGAGELDGDERLALATRGDDPARAATCGLRLHDVVDGLKRGGDRNIQRAVGAC